MKTPNATQIPLLQPIATRDGLLPNVWVMFFQKIADVVNQADANGDLIEIMQLAHQLPTNAQQAQQSHDIAALQNTFSTTPIYINQDIEIPPAMAVFLCHEDVMPLCAVQAFSDSVFPSLNLPSSEIIHD